MPYFLITISERLKTESLAILTFPILLAMISLQVGFTVDRIAMFWVAVMVAVLMTLVLRWAMFDKNKNLGLSISHYWEKRAKDKGASWTHGSS